MRILYSISFQFGRIWTKLNVLTHVASKIYFTMMKIWKNEIWNLKCGIEKIFFNDEKLKKWNLRLLKSSVRIYAHSLFHFIPIWTNLNETHLPYSCGIEIIYFNDEKLKKWNLNLLKSSMCIYAHIWKVDKMKSESFKILLPIFEKLKK